MELFEVDLLSVPNQDFSTTINDVDIYIKIRSLGEELFFSVKSDLNNIIDSIRLPINTLFYIPGLDISLFFIGSYDWETLGVSSNLYFVRS